MKIIAFIVSLILVTFIYVQPVNAEPIFRDIEEDHWAFDEVNDLVKKGIVSGYEDGTFKPNATLTRAQMAVMLSIALDLELKNRPNPNFTDVYSNFWAYNSIAAVAEEGIITGNDGRFHPSENLTRAQMAVVLRRAFDLIGTTEHRFRDISQNFWAYEDIQSLAANGITTGYEDNTFRPNVPVTRIQFVAFLARSLKLYEEENPVTEEPEENEEIEVEFEFSELNTHYVSPDNNMTVTMKNIEVIDNQGIYEYRITYIEQNNTIDKVIDQGAFKVFYVNGESEPQYGFFNRLFPTESETRTYTFKALKYQEPYLVEYGSDLFFNNEPKNESLKWKIELP